nr:hypothetical protein [Tanacetum cinerariifolium]
MLVIKRFRERNKIFREIKLSENFMLRVDCLMVVKEIENGLLEEVEVSLFRKKVMILMWMSCVSILFLPTFLVFLRSQNGGLSKTLMMKKKRIKKMEVVMKYEN